MLLTLAREGVGFSGSEPDIIVARYQFNCANVQRCRACVVYRSQETKILKLARHCAVAGVVLGAGLIATSALLGPGGPGPSIVKDQPKVDFARPVRIIPLERPREDKPLQQSAAGTAQSTVQPANVVPAPPARSEPTPTFTALTGLPTPEEAARATRIAQEKIAAEKARKRRIARERAHARAIAAARSQDQQSYDQHTWSGQAYAPRQSYGPFGRAKTGWGHGWNGWGGGWKGQNGKW